MRLGEILKSLGKGKRPASFENNNGNIYFYKSSLEVYKCNEADFDTEALIIGDGGSANIHYVNGKFSSSDHTYIFAKSKNDISLRYVYFVIRNHLEILEVGFKGIALKNIAKKFIENEVKIPLPPLEIQSQIVSECEEVEKQFNAIKMSIEEYKNLIKAILVKTGICEDSTNGGGAFELDFATILATLTTTLSSLQGDNSPKQSTNEANLNALKALLSSLPVPPKEGWEQYRLSDTKIFKLQIGKRVLDSELTTQGKIPVYSANVKKPFGYINKEILKDYENDSVLWGIDGDWLVSFMPKNTPFYPTDHCGVLQVNNDAIKPKILSFILDETGKKRRFDRNLRASIERIQALKLAIPPLKEQEKIVSAIEYIENEMTDLAKRLDILESQKSKILEKYL